MRNDAMKKRHPQKQAENRWQKPARLLLTLSLLLSGVACTTEEVEDRFEESASARLASTLDHARRVLRSAPYGWEFDYYPGATAAYGGLVYTVRFDSLTATVGCSLIADSTVTSHYRLTNDSGPVLTFDTYNDLFHYYSTPSSSEYEAKGGEFEFVIDSIADDLITLSGKKTGNAMYLRRLSTAADDYASKTIDIFDHFVDSLSGTIGTAAVRAKCNPSARSLTAITGTDTASIRYAYTNRGIRLHQPWHVGGVSVQAFDFDTQSGQLSCTDPGTTGITLQGFPYSSDFMSYPRYEGDYILAYGSNTVDVHLAPNRLEGTYLLEGLSPRYKLVLRYDSQSGHLTLGSQAVGESGGRTVYWVCYDYEDGYLSLSDEGQFTISWNGNRFYPRFNFTTTNPRILNCTGGLLVYLFYNADGNLAAGILDDPDWLTNGSMQFRELKSLNRRTRL